MSLSLITELRQPKLDLFGTQVAVLDLSLTLLGAYLLSKKVGINPYLGMASSIPVGYLTHKIFQVDTPLTNKFDSLTSTPP